MKKIITYLIVFLINTLAFGQTTIYNASTNDMFDANDNEYNVNNTGNDILDNQGGNVMQISVCDGDNPHICWMDNSTSGVQKTQEIESQYVSNSEIIDPDVALVEYYPSNQNPVFIAIITFETTGGNIWYIAKKYDPINLIWFTIDYRDLQSGTNPNVDASTIDFNNIDYFVITWECSGDIMAFSGDVSGPSINISNTATIYDNSISGNDAITPDVTVSTYYYLTYYPYNTVTVAVTFTFISNNVLYAHQEDFPDVFNGSINSNNLVSKYTYNSTDYYGRPRIGSPDIQHGGSAYGIYDYTIVIDAILDPTVNNINYVIQGFNKYFATSNYYNYEYTSTSGIYEGLPVVSYCGDMIAVSWVLDNSSYDKDVIQRQLGSDGSFNTNYASKVNMNASKDQTIPSISGTYATNDLFYTFIDNDDNHLKTKVSQNYSQYIRKGLIGSMKLFPNPAVDEINIDVSTSSKVTITNTEGKTILSKVFDAGVNKIDVSPLKSGIYFIQTLSENESNTQKLIIQ